MTDISRRCFLEAASLLTGSALIAGCQNGGAIAGSVSPTNGTAQLTFAMFPKLQTVGDGVVVDVGGQELAVIRTGDMTATALSAVCTHAGCLVEIQSGNPPLFCPCHGSEFDLGGAVARGPARSPLRVYPATVDANGVTVTVG
jgi:cytochrome b6-f complex iron-sulfur subunit